MAPTVSTNPHADYFAAKARVLDMLATLGAKSRETAVSGLHIYDEFGEPMLMDAQKCAATGAEVKYRSGYGYWSGYSRNNGRA